MKLLTAAAFALATLWPLAASAQPATAPPAGTPHELAIGTGATALHGTFLDSGHAGPAVLIIAGSGPTDRNGDSTVPGVRPATLRLIAEGLAANGISSLRFDKRAIGASAGAVAREEDLRFSTYVDDAVAWAHLLRSQHGVSCVVILGHSEGSLIGALAAAHTPVCGLVEIAGPGRPFGDVLAEQLRAASLPPELLTASLHIIDELRAGRTVADTPPQLAALFRPSVQPYLISQMNIDPAQAFAAVHAPGLVMQGDRDFQVSLADAQRLHAARPDTRLVVLAGVNHVLKDAPAERGANLATYADPNLPLAADVVPTLVQFVRGLHPAP
jgi:pimeloyl-ACP methyl ester carboxylesterase